MIDKTLTLSAMPVGYIFEASNGKYVLVDRMSAALPDSEVDKVMKLGVTEDSYKKTVARKEAEMDENYFQKRASGKKNMTAGYIYAVVCGDKLKLGRTTNMNNRMMAYKRASHNFRLIAATHVVDYKTAEFDLLKTFGIKSGESEWSDYSEDLEYAVSKYFRELQDE